ncbi:MmgE/PrpD family protein [Pusillimonas sp. ANT_WB101]|uniref:MmgE/PrpD family protein n=1 Tax=Pusillimonas sp. ANT_WB101 TaxID=2597356 RepID=UPI0011EF925A|nr:MmgE/PrpD family protein [Pusillimonas sp. ANT_WB101]KAA0892517.1 MmgE/PrpD family protein [Pusillimonas sp. ANT_WB101]
MNTGSPLSRQLIDLLARPITTSDRERAALHVLDWMGCAAAGLTTPPGQVFSAYAATLAPGQCPVIGGLSLSASDAALINGTMGNVLEMDDFYRTALVHPGPVVVPAALAMAAATDASGDAFLDAVIKGFEVMIRIGDSVGPRHYRYFHNTATCGVFGAAVAAGSLLGLNADTMVHALGQAGTMASGLWQCRIEDTMSKQLHTGRAAQSGVMSAQLASMGLTGATQILEGDLGFFNAMCPDGQPENLLVGADNPWRIHGTSFKPWPACRHTHATIDAALALLTCVNTDQITHIVVKSFRDAVQVCDRALPVTSVQAKFSLQHASAITLLFGKPKLEHFSAAYINDETVAALRAKVVLEEASEMTQVYPQHFGSSMHIEHADGTIVTHTVNDALGDPENPMSLSQLQEKAAMLLTSAGYDTNTLSELTTAALALPGALTIKGLSSLIR